MAASQVCLSFGGDDHLLELDRGGDYKTRMWKARGPPTCWVWPRLQLMSYQRVGLREGTWGLHLTVSFSTEQKLFLTHSQTPVLGLGPDHSSPGHCGVDTPWVPSWNMAVSGLCGHYHSSLETVTEPHATLSMPHGQHHTWSCGPSTMASPPLS